MSREGRLPTVMPDIQLGLNAPDPLIQTNGTLKPALGQALTLMLANLSMLDD